ncbi:hypothetical protein F5Y14DRAFT_404972 [Nemania sp. NC0429]|nr:hypothetical protein F5Y14DRAFT_404972 [Nemania sp. NC0429]
MQRLGGPFVIPKLQANINTRLWQCQTRHARNDAGRPKKGSSRKKTPTFEFSNLLLDLDAYDVQGVRPHDSMIDGVPETSSAKKARDLVPIRERVAEFEKAYKESNANFKFITADKFHPLHITDFDLLAVAMLDAPNISNLAQHPKSHLDNPVSYPDVIDSVLRQNGVPGLARRSTSNTIAYMLRRRHLVSRSLPLQSQDRRRDRDDDEELIRQALRKYPNFSDIDRLVAMVAKSSTGCQTLLRTSDELYASLVQAPDVEPLQLLSLLNNLAINLDRYKLDLPAELYELGISTSLECQAIVTAQHYIKRRLEHGSYDHDFINAILNKLLQTSIVSSSPELVSYQFQMDASDRLTAVFSLLTGYVPGETQPAASLRSVVKPERPDSFHLYIQCLARLGAFRTIWHEWHNSNSASRSVESGAPEELASAENNYFVTAILDALAKNRRIGELAESPYFTTLSGQFQEDCQLDMIAISRSANLLALPEEGNVEYNSTPNHAEIREQLYHILREKHIEEAFSALQKFLNHMTSSS